MRGILITAAFTLLGGIVGVLGKGCYDLAIEKEKSHAELDIEKTKVEADIQLEKEKFESNKKIERQKLDEDLIKLALQSSETDKRTEALSFMVETGLIADSDIKKGVESYLAAKKPVPGLLPSPFSETNQLVSSHGNTITLRLADGYFRVIKFDADIVSTQLSPDTSKIVVATSEPKVRIIDLTGHLRETDITPPSIPDSTKFTEDGKEILLQHSNENLYYDLQGNRVLVQ